MYIVRVSSSTLTPLLAVFWPTALIISCRDIYIYRKDTTSSFHHSLFLLPYSWQNPCISYSLRSPPLASNESRNADSPRLGFSTSPPVLESPNTGVAPTFIDPKNSTVFTNTEWRYPMWNQKWQNGSFVARFIFTQENLDVSVRSENCVPY